MQLVNIICLILLALGSVKCTRVYQNNGQTYATNGDVEIIINSSTFKCDRITCPKATTDRCVVMKRNLPENPRIVRRENYCIGADNQILNKIIQDESVGENTLISEYLVVSRSGNSYNVSANLSPEEQKELNDSMKKLEEDLNKIGENIKRDMLALENELKMTFSGNFPFN